jgi:formylglycine-generating enzyme
MAFALFVTCSKKSNPTDNDENPSYPAVIGTMKLISGGTFQMGSTNGISDEQVHTVTISSFYMDSTEVTQDDFQSLMNVNPSHFKSNIRQPVEYDSWYDAVLYCNMRSKRDKLDTIYSFNSITGETGQNYGCSALGNLKIEYNKNGYRLPTEAEWEYACRGGTTTDFFWGDLNSGDKDKYMWYYDNSISTHTVSTKLPNAFGLYDMSGNVWEWCNDWYGEDYYKNSPGSNPQGPATGFARIFRGGAWTHSNINATVFFRGICAPGYRGYSVGFRLVMVP